MRNTGAIYLYILAVQKGLKFFEDYLEKSFLMLLTDPSKYYYFNIVLITYFSKKKLNFCMRFNKLRVKC